MRSLDVVVFCSSAIRIKHFVKSLEFAEVGRVEVISGRARGELSNALALDIGLVICDSFFSSTEISLFRRLCEQAEHFETYENDELEAHTAWGIKRLTARGKKACVGRYAGLPSAIQVARAVAMAMLRKRRRPEEGRVPASPVSPLSMLSRAQVLSILEQRQIVPYYQPKLCLKTERILGVEILARWQHPDKGLLAPSIFLPMVDEFHLQGALFECMLEQAMQVHKTLLLMGETLIFSYNIEATQLQEEGFASTVIERIQQAGISPNLVTLEVTENQALDMQMAAIENITLLTQGGISLSLDDFGTGFSSLERLTQLPFSQIKLDSNFIAGALDEKQTRIIGFLSELSYCLGMELVAEGVESEQQFLHLKKLGVDSAQGYFFHPPMSAASLTKVLLGEDRSGLKLLSC